MIKGQDVLVLLKLFVSRNPDVPFHKLATDLDMSPAEVHEATKRAEKSGLLAIIPSGRNQKKLIKRGALEELLVHAVRYICPPTLGPVTHGMPTIFGAPFFPKILLGDELPPVWPTLDGQTKGIEFSPIYRSAPAAAQRDPALYELLVFVDAIRGGKAREREIGEAELRKRIRDGKSRE